MSDKKEAKEEILKGLVDQARSALCGLSASGIADSAVQLKKLVQVGRLSAEQATRLEKHLQVQLGRVRAVFEREVNGIALAMAQRLQKLANDELVDIQERLQKLETHPKLGPSPKQL